MKKLIVLIIIILIVGCNSVIGPENPEPEPQEILSAEIEILKWTQIYNERLDRYENVEVIYTIGNTGNVGISRYELGWIFIEEEDGFPECWTKTINYFKDINIGETITDTLNTGKVRRDKPVTEVRCEITQLN